MTLRDMLTSDEVSFGYKLATVLAFLAFITMSGAIMYGFIVGDFAGEGSYMLSIPWGRVSLIDVYIGFFFIGGWILYREPSFWSSLPWIILLMIFGNAAAGLYIFLALIRGDGNWQTFWLGSNA